MNDTKNESTQNGWATSEANTAAGWDAAKVDQSTVERIEVYEQQFRDERTVKRAEREARAEEVTYVTEVDVTDPSRVYTPLERQEPQPQEHETDAPELDGGGDAASIAEEQVEQAAQSEADVADVVLADAQIDTAETEIAAERAELEAALMVAHGAEIEAAEPVSDPAAGWEASQPLLNAAEMDSELLQRKAVAEIDPERAAAMAEVEHALGGHDQGHDIER